MIDLAQQSGRAGRDGERTLSVHVWDHSLFMGILATAPRFQTEYWMNDLRQVVKWVLGCSCRRQALLICLGDYVTPQVRGVDCCDYCESLMFCEVVDFTSDAISLQRLVADKTQAGEYKLTSLLKDVRSDSFATVTESCNKYLLVFVLFGEGYLDFDSRVFSSVVANKQNIYFVVRVNPALHMKLEAGDTSNSHLLYP